MKSAFSLHVFFPCTQSRQRKLQMCHMFNCAFTQDQRKKSQGCNLLERQITDYKPYPINQSVRGPGLNNTLREIPDAVCVKYDQWVMTFSLQLLFSDQVKSFHFESHQLSLSNSIIYFTSLSRIPFSKWVAWTKGCNCSLFNERKNIEKEMKQTLNVSKISRYVTSIFQQRSVL